MTWQKPFDAFVAPARLKPQIWRLIVGMVLISVAFFAVAISLILIVPGTVGYLDDIYTYDACEFETGQLCRSTIWVELFAFSGAIVGVWLAARGLHKRSFASLLGSRDKFFRDFGCAVLVLFGIYGLLYLGLFGAGIEPLPLAQHDFLSWVSVIFPITVAALLVQTLAEEIVFRGYLQQQFAARFQGPLVWLFVPSLVFGLLHYDPVLLGGNVWAFIIVISFSGIVMADLTARTGTLGAAWGLHWANNVIALLLFGYDDPYSTLALFLFPYSAADTPFWSVMFWGIAVPGSVWLILRRLLAR
ncbi:MAG: CPBP family intramembrane metalloprotease [Marinovum sp.]|nr:CPBP family intramembrane metalloprotease [Marinovum sp.]